MCTETSVQEFERTEIGIVMKKNPRCPSCNCNRIYHMHPVSTPDHDGMLVTRPVAIATTIVKGGSSFWSSGWQLLAAKN